MIWLRIVPYLAALGVGFALCLWTYANPRIDGLKAGQAAAEVRAATEHAQFLKESRDEQTRMQQQVDNAYRVAEQASVERGRALAAANASDGKLRNAERALQAHIAGLPEAARCAANESAAAAYRDMAEEADGFAGEVVAELDRLDDEVRRLEASR